MKKIRTVEMEDSTLIATLVALVGAFGVKEIWGIWKKKLELKSQKEIRQEESEDKAWRAEGKLLAKVIEELKSKIGELETKIDTLVEENTALKVKIGKMEEQLMANATASSRRKNSVKNKK